MRLYLDASAIIYSIEGATPLQQSVLAHMLRAQAPGGAMITSRLSWLECRVKPLRDGNASLLALYDAFFSSSSLRVVEIGSAIVERATDLRAKYGFKTPDAFHLATAIEENAQSFLTGDKGLARCVELNVELV